MEPLPLLQTPNVVLPGSLNRLTLDFSTHTARGLIEHLVQQSATAATGGGSSGPGAEPTSPPLIAVLPVANGCSGSSGMALPRAQGTTPPHQSIATAARVLQLSHTASTKDWALLLEGVCRVSVDSLEELEGGDFMIANVTQLEPEAVSLAQQQQQQQQSTHSQKGSMLNGQDESPEVAELASQLRGMTALLLKKLMSRQAVGGANVSMAVRRVLETLESMPPAQAADTVAAAFSVTFEERLSVLHALEHAPRLRLALSHARNALKAVAASTKPGPPSRFPLMGNRSGPRVGPGSTTKPPPPSTVGPSNNTAGGGSHGRDGLEDLFDEEDGEEEDELAAVMARLARARPPPEVARAAVKECKRLRQMGGMHQSAAISQQFLDILADLPWSRTSADAACEAAAAAAASTVAHAQQGGSTNQEADANTAGNSSSTATSARQRHAGKARKDALPAQAAVKGTGVRGSQAAQQAGEQGAVPPSIPHTPHPVPLPPANLSEARKMLDAHHFGLDKIKDRVVEHLAVLRLKGNTASAPILLFVGPPGVGKTSLARSVADVLGRPYVRIALGGVRDEAEIRGHRRTYVGAMPGRIIQGLRKAAVCDPVLLLDELDKVGQDHIRGDPAAALLEVLDPEQNVHFTDTYLGLPFDLSKVTFVATANRASHIPHVLLDRMEVISLSGYTLEEKVHIGLVHLLPKLLSEHGLTPANLHLPETIMAHIIERYTNEAGVRGLSRCLAAICRHVAVSIITQRDMAAALHALPSSHAHHTHEEPAAFAGVHTGALAHMGAHAHTPPLGQPPTPPTTAAAQHALASQPHAGDKQLPVLHAPPPSFPPQGSLADVSEAPLTGLGSHPSLPRVSEDSNPSWLHTLQQPNQHPHQHQQNQQHHHQHTQQYSQQQQQQQQQQQHAHTAPASTSTSSSGGSGGGLRSWLPMFPLPRASPQGTQPAAHSTATNTSASSSRGGAVVESGHMLKQGKVARMRSQHHQHQPHAADGSVLPVLDGEGEALALPYPPDLLQQHAEAMVVTEQLVEIVLGPAPYGVSEASERVQAPGCATGLVWTATGGSVQYVECVRTSVGQNNRPGTLTLTGQVGEVLEESAQIALSWIRAHAHELQLDAPGGSMTKTSHTKMSQPMQHPSSPSAHAVYAALPVHASSSSSSSSSPHAAFPVHTSSSTNSSSSGPHNHPSSNASSESSSGMVGAWGAPTHTHSLQDLPLDLPTSQLPEDADSAPAKHSARIELLNPASCWDLHLHLPAGSIPKDGPSAGVTLAVTLISVLTGRCVRADTAMTGELTLRGLVLPVGGLKEKLLAARRAGLVRAIVPARNMPEIMADVSPAVRAALRIIPVQHLEEALEAAFDTPLRLLPPRSRL